MSKKYFLPFIISLLIGGFLLRNYLQFDKRAIEKEEKTQEILVTKVIDGDTIEIESKERVRYLGIDAPELDKSHGIPSARYNEELVLNKQVRLEFDQERLDSYGRILAYVWLENVLVNEELLEEGHARISYLPTRQRLKYLERLEEAERSAREYRKGIWSNIENF